MHAAQLGDCQPHKPSVGGFVGTKHVRTEMTLHGPTRCRTGHDLADAGDAHLQCLGGS